MVVLTISLLGPFTAALDDTPLETLGTTKAQALLIYLAVEKARPHRREQLFTLLWPGMPEKSARHNLRQIFPAGEDASQLLLADRLAVQLNPDARIEVDLQRMESLLQGSKTHSHDNLADCVVCIQGLEEAVDLYRGDFLSDFYLEDSNVFEDWAQAVRGNSRGMVLEALSTLGEIYLEKNTYAKALGSVDRALTIDNLRESAHRQRLEVLARGGRRVEALRHYREYVQLLENELQVAPSQEITALYERIRGEDLFQELPHFETAPREDKLPRTNLTPQLTPFIGRETELAKLDAMLADPNTRLITITGQGGMGKTRLAIACAERQLYGTDGRGGSSRSTPVGEQTHPFPDGVFFVPFADINNPDQIPREIIKALNLSLNPGGGDRDGYTVQQQLQGYLQRKQLLLVLDNFEQLLEGSVFLNEILQVSKCVQLLVTSRERLHLQSEQAFPIDGLKFPDWEAPQDTCDYTAMQLFQECARRVSPDFKFKPGDMIYLTRICRLLGGMPLGLELAASWVDMLSVIQIAEEIQTAIDFLETDVRDLPERHRSLQAVCDSTWVYLNETEKLIFGRLSIFKGGFSQEAAHEITGASFLTLSALRRKSLIQYDPENERYRIHPYLRQYGRKRLDATSQNSLEILDRHCAFFSSFVEKGTKIAFVGLTIVDLNQIEIKILNTEIGNILAAWDWAIEHEQVTRIAQALDGLYQYFNWNYQDQEILSICQHVNQMLISIETPSVLTQTPAMDIVGRVRAKALNYLGFHTFPYDNTKALLFFDQSEQILNNLTEAGYDIRVEKAQLMRFKAININDYNSAKILFTESIRLSEETNDFGGIFESKFFSGSKAVISGLLQEAKDWAEQGFELAQMQNSYCWKIHFQLILSRVSRRLRNYNEAIQYYQNIISEAAPNGNDRPLANALEEFSWLMVFLGHLEEATNLSYESIRIAEKIELNSYSSTFLTLGVIQWLSGLFDQAGKSIIAFFATEKDSYHWLFLARRIMHIEFLIVTGRYQGAREIIEVREYGTKGSELLVNLDPCRFLRLLGILELVEDHFDLAKMKLLESIDAIQTNQEYVDEFSAWSKAFLAAAEYGLGDIDRAKEILTEALSTVLNIQGYIPMVFNLPMTLLFLVKEDLVLAAEVYQVVMRDPFLGKAQLFHDLVYQHLPKEITSIPVETVETSPEHREGLWAAARKVLVVWKGDLVVSKSNPTLQELS